MTAEIDPAAEGEVDLLLVTGRDRAGLLATLGRIAARLAAGQAVGTDGRWAHPGDPERLAIVTPPGGLAPRIALARERLAALRRPRLVLRDHGLHFAAGAVPGRVAFLFPGEGSQRAGMLRQAIARLAPVRDWLDALDAAYRDAGEPAPSRLLAPQAGLAKSAPTEQRRRLFDIAHAGQLCTVANLAYLEVLQAVGVTPDVLVGHSNGEHAAVMAACMDPARDRARICAWLRTASLAGRQVAAPDTPERVAAVAALEMPALAAIIERHPGALFLAMDNSPLQQVIAGTAAAVEAATGEIAAAGGICRVLPFERAYHTPLFAEWAAVLARCYAALPLQSPRVAVISCATAAAMPADPAALRAVMAAQWTAPIRLRDTILALHDAGVRTFIEVGPDSRLSSLVEDGLRGRPHLAGATASASQPDLTQLLRLLASLHVQGLDIDQAALQQLLIPAAPVVAPIADRPLLSTAASGQAALLVAARASMARMEQAFRATRPDPPIGSPAAPRCAGGLLGECLHRRHDGVVGERHFSWQRDPFLADHSFVRPPGRPLAVFSFTTSLALAAEAARHLARRAGPLVLTDLRAGSWLALDGDGLHLRIDAAPAGAEMRIRLSDAGTAAFTAAALLQAAPNASPGDDARTALRPPRRWSPASFYADYAFHGPCFRGLRRVIGIGPQGLDAELVVTDLKGTDRATLEADPALLDCAGQMVAFWLLEQHGMPPTTGAFPYAAARVVLHRPPPPAGTSVTCRVRAALHGEGFVRADAAFAVDGVRLVTILGLEQRVLRLPQMIAACLFGDGTAVRVAALRESGLADWLDGHGGIWARVLAHALLDDAGFAAWRRDPDPGRLLDRLHGGPARLEAVHG
jgi:malonyl CoA-acyl carrier protein transacylase